MIEWPESLPLPSYDFSDEVMTSTLRTTVEGGATKRRSRFRSQVKKVRVQWVFSPSQFATFRTFVREDLRHGSASFHLDLLEAAGLVKRELQLEGGNYEVRQEDGSFRVEGTLLLNRHTLTLPPLEPPPAPVAIAADEITVESFRARWGAADSATGYRLDVSADPEFASFVEGYEDLDVGAVTSYEVTGLEPETVYYYRVRAYNAAGTSVNSNVETVSTGKAPGHYGDFSEYEDGIYTTLGPSYALDLTDMTTRLPMQIITKPTSIGSDKALVLPPKSRWVMELDIPHWSYIKVGLFLSITTADDPNANFSPAGGWPLVAAPSGNTDQDYLGGIILTDNPLAYGNSPGVSGYWMGGHGSTTPARNAASLDRTGSNGPIIFGIDSGGNSSVYAFFNNGSYSSFVEDAMKIPTGRDNGGDLSGFATSVALSIDRRGSSTLFGKLGSAVTNARTDNSLAAIESFTVNAGMGNQRGLTGKHTGHTPYLCIQWPFTECRLRVNAWYVHVEEEA